VYATLRPSAARSASNPLKHYCSTPGCPREAHYRGRCQKCSGKLDPLAHPNKAIYDSAAWRGFRLRRLALNPFCQDPHGEGCQQPAREVDHIVPIEKGGAVFSIENTQCLCKPCHSRKTRSEQSRRGQALGITREPATSPASQD